MIFIKLAILLLATVVFFYGVSKLIDCFINLKCLLSKDYTNNPLHRSEGIVVNTKTGEVEGDSKTIPPF